MDYHATPDEGTLTGSELEHSEKLSGAQLARRSVFSIHIVPLQAPLTLPMRKLHVTLTRMAGLQFQTLPMAERSQVHDDVRTAVQAFRSGSDIGVPKRLTTFAFSAKLRDIAEQAGYEPSDARALIAPAQQLCQRLVSFNVLQHKAAPAEQDLYPADLEVNMPLLAHVMRNKRGDLSWSYHPILLSIMVQPRTYAELNLELVRNARTYTALALYENTRRFVAIGRAGPYPLLTWQRLLSPSGQPPQWEDSREFRRRLKRSIAELHSCEGCDIRLEPENVHLPGTGAGLVIHVSPVEQSKLAFGAPLPPDPNLHRRLTGLGYSADSARILVEERGEEYVHAKFALLERTAGVRNPRAWLDAAIERDFRDERTARLQALEQKVQASELSDAAADARVRFATFQQERLRQRFDEADEDVRSRWEAAYAEAKREGEGMETWALTGAASQGRALGTSALDIPEGVRKAAYRAAFFRWLLPQPHGFLTQPEELDPVAFALSGIGRQSNEAPAAAMPRSPRRGAAPRRASGVKPPSGRLNSQGQEQSAPGANRED